MKKHGVVTYSPCLNTRTGEVHLLDPIRGPQRADLEETNGRDPIAATTQRLLLDVEMLRKGHMFYGLFDSNLVRMVHRLRFPNFQMSFALAAETYPDDRKYINSHLDNIPMQLFVGGA
jgi:hypothetical protein